MTNIKENYKPANLLILEDTIADYELTKISMEDSFLINELRWARDCKEFFNIVNEGYTPDIIFVDINIPGESGFDCIKKYKLNHNADATIIIVSGSEHENDIALAASLGCEGYITKPLNYKKLQQLIDTLKDFNWLLVKKLNQKKKFA